MREPREPVEALDGVGLEAELTARDREIGLVARGVDEARERAADRARDGVGGDPRRHPERDRGHERERPEARA